jgi:hypothetical protein
MLFDKKLESLKKNSALDLKEWLMRLPIIQAVSWSERMSRAKALGNVCERAKMLGNAGRRRSRASDSAL